MAGTFPVETGSLLILNFEMFWWGWIALEKVAEESASRFGSKWLIGELEPFESTGSLI